MTVDPEDKNKLKVYLTDREVARIFGGYNKINYDDPRSKAALGLILKQALNCGGFMPSGERLLIEVKPHKKGCLISFSGADTETKPHPKKNQTTYTYTLCFEDENALIDGIGQLHSAISKISESRLYSLNNIYCLTLKSEKDLNRYMIHMNEYCTKITAGQTQAAYCAEYGKLLCPDNVVKTIDRVSGIKEILSP